MHKPIREAHSAIRLRPFSGFGSVCGCACGYARWPYQGMIDRPRTGGLHASALCMGETRPQHTLLCRPALLCLCSSLHPLALYPFGSFPGETCTALRYCKIFIEIRPHPPLPDHRTVGFWLMHVSGGRAAALLVGDSHRKWNSKCFSEYLN